MLIEAIGMATLSFAVGVALIAIGAGLAVPQRLESAGRFDITVGTALLLYGAAILWMRPSGVWFVFPIFLGYFLAGLYLFRRSYILPTFPNPDHRARDIGASLLLWLAGTTAMISLAGGKEAFLLWFLLPALLIGALGGLFLLVDVVRHLRGQHVYRRDVVSAAALISSLLLYVVLFRNWFYIDATVV